MKELCCRKQCATIAPDVKLETPILVSEFGLSCARGAFYLQDGGTIYGQRKCAILGESYSVGDVGLNIELCMKENNE